MFFRLGWIGILIAFALPLLFIANCSILAETSTVVRVEAGTLRGVADDSMVRFQGVPYAAPPVGALRWTAPQPVPSWAGIREATTLANSCPQDADTLNEDCLYLNLTVPRSPNRTKPVMVWLHGGGLVEGTGNTYDPKRLAIQGDVIVATVNFRKGVLGYFGYPGLTGSGTFGLQDQQAALRWIKRNIAAFGGDPNNVTLFGESGGAVAACAHLTSPGAAELIHKAILQSGACTMSWARNAAYLGQPAGSFFRSRSQVETEGKAAAIDLGCSQSDSTAAIACLRQLPVLKLLDKTGEFGYAAYNTELLPYDPAQAITNGKFMAVPIISGTTLDEARTNASGIQLTGIQSTGKPPITEESYPELLADAFDDRTAEVQSRYPRNRYGSAVLAWSAIYTDRMYTCPQLVTTRAFAARSPTFAYEFADPNAPGLVPFLPDFPPGTPHTSELSYLFDLDNAPLGLNGKIIQLNEQQRELANKMVQYWTRFAHTGNPNGGTNPQWQRFEVNNPMVQFLASGQGGIRMVDDVATRHQCQFWASFFS
jgi:para-nitrobenzyl esterase